MEREELETYEYQLAQIKQSLQADPGNAELLALEEELSTLISMTKEYLGMQPGPSSSSAAGAGAASASSAAPSKPSTSTATAGAPTASSKTAAAPAAVPARNSGPVVPFTAGSEVLAKWHVDGKFYPARIASVSGSTSDPVYTVIFNIDSSTEVLRHADVKAPKDYSRKRGYEQDYSSNKRGDSPAMGTTVTDDGGEAGPDGGPKKVMKKAEKKAVKEDERKARVAEQNAKQTSWQSFAKKSVKKGVKIAGFTGESQFKSPDNPYGRVGVVGSGKGVTQHAEKKRAVFAPTSETNP